MKSIDDALELRGRIFGAFELAELETDPAAVDRWLTFVVVGAGATGVEMAGQIAELAHRTLPGQYRRIDPKQSRIILVDALDAVLPTFGDHLSTQALRQLHKMGVEVELGTKVVDVDAGGIEVETKHGRRRIESMTKMWAAGVAAPALSRQVAAAAGAETDRAGRIKVNPDCTVPGHPEIFAVGDMMALDQLPGVAQVAIQSGRYAARQITRRLQNEPADKPFKYFDTGSMATISRFSAVASIGKTRFAGFVAWLLWLGVHLLYLVGFKNRLTTVLHWFVSFIGSGRSERVATVQQVLARNVMKQRGEPPA
jgi:NADH dehydrogenase